MTYQIPDHLYDGTLHRVATRVGADFVAKWEALRADGFTVAVTDGGILACKIMPGDPIPAMSEETAWSEAIAM